MSHKVVTLSPGFPASFFFPSLGRNWKEFPSKEGIWEGIGRNLGRNSGRNFGKRFGWNIIFASLLLSLLDIYPIIINTIMALLWLFLDFLVVYDLLGLQLFFEFDFFAVHSFYNYLLAITIFQCLFKFFICIFVNNFVVKFYGFFKLNL